MNNKARVLIIFPIISLLAVVAGGFFVSRQWQVDVYVPEEPLSEEVDITPPTEDIIVLPAEDKTEEELELKIQILIQESQEIINRAQEFIKKEKEKQRLVAQAKERSSQVKGIYVGPAIRQAYFEDLLNETELNGLVIDVKEVDGMYYLPRFEKLLLDLQQKDFWMIARIVVFRDSSLIEEHPEWYLTTSSEGYWLDPANSEVQDYIIEFSKEVIDSGFDELQFDYIRFPADKNNYYQEKERYEIIQEFFFKLSEELKDYKPSIILSADLFGYVATQFAALDIGQRLIDAGKAFDYISPMLYPSHFYNGFQVGEDLKRGLPALYYPYDSEDIDQVSSSHPYNIILRSVLTAVDFLSAFGLEAKIRPWLQDFDLISDSSRGIIYDAEKIKSQIRGAQDADAAGWLFWNAAIIYTKEAFLEP